MKSVSERKSECSGTREQSEPGGASKRVSGASEQANGRASGPVLQSGFLVVLDYKALEETCRFSYSGTRNKKDKRKIT